MGRPRCYPALAWLLLGLVACGAGERAPAAPGTAAPAATVAAATTAPAPATAAAAATIATVPPDTSFLGPVIGFNLEDTYEDYYLGLFDAGTGAFREIHNIQAPIAPYEAHWFDGGCLLYANGHLLDLRGAIVWSLPDEIAGETINLHTSLLSPDRGWLAHVVDTDVGERHVEIVRLSAPFDSFRLTERGGGHPETMLWAVEGDTLWLLFSDYDANARLQLYRAHPDGTGRAQLAALDPSPPMINALALSPDGGRLAFGARAATMPAQPYIYDPADEGWVGVIDMTTGAWQRTSLPGLAGVELGQGLVWSADGTRLLIIGDGLPLPAGDPLAGRQVHWLAADGALERSFYQADAPSAQLGWVSPLGDVDRLLFSSSADIYRYDAGQLRRLEGGERPPIGDIGRRPVGVVPAAVGFGGEAGCR